MQARGLGRAASLRGWRFLSASRMAWYGRARAGLLKAAGRRHDHLGRRHLAWGEVRTGCHCINGEHSQLLTWQWPKYELDQE